MIEVQRDGKGFKAVALVPGTAGVTVFKACFYETAVAQALVRDGNVMFEGQKIEAPRKLTRRERMEREWRR